MIKCIIFDLDGILVDTKPLHFESLNIALQLIDGKEKKYVISWDEHLKIYDGLPTKKKLQLLTKNKGLPIELYDKVWLDKQYNTKDLLKKRIGFSKDLVTLFCELRSNGYKLFVATNSIKETTKIMLDNIGILPLLDGYLTNEDVKNPKPHPEIYLRTILESGFLPSECLILEDSIAGITSAQNSCAHVMIINKMSEVNKENIMNKTEEINNGKVKKKFPFKGNILIPMAGEGSRFQKAGYIFPKPLIDTIDNKPMIQLVVESLGLEGNYIYLVRKEHLEKFNMQQTLNLITPGCKIVVVDKLTDGACCTTLLGRDLINHDLPLIIANSDQYIEWKPEEFLYLMNNQNVDAGILTFRNTHPKWSYAKLNNDGYVSEVAEKNPISDNATVGIYFYKKGSDYVKYAEQMINKNIRVNNEFYVAPVFNEFIQDNKKIKIYDVDKMIGCGTPEDLDNLKNQLK